MMSAAAGLVASGFGAASAWMSEASRAATSGLVAAVWQGLLLSLVVGLGLRLLPKTPAAVRFAIWFGVFAVVAALPIAALLPHGGVAETGGHAAWLMLDGRWCLAVAGAWMIASLVRAVTLLLAVFRVRALWKRAIPLEMPADAALGVGTRRAQLCVSDEVDRPTVIGFFSPKILIPDWLVEKLTPVELEQVLLHEAGHLGRADDWMNLLQKVALVVFPLNPALEWVERRLCFERELACDERVLKTTNAPKAYAACLTTLAEHGLRRRGVALALGVLGRESELGQRVGRILRRGESMRPLHGKLVLGGAMLGLLAAAVALEHCPQMVGFAPAGAMTASASVPMSGGAGMRGYAYQAVVFHPKNIQSNGLQVRAKVLHTKKASMVVRAAAPSNIRQRVSPEAVAGAYGMHTISLRSRSDAATSGKTDIADVAASDMNTQPPQVVRWVVVTSWQGEDGSRMVLTTASSSSPVGMVVRSQGVSDSETSSKSDSDSDQVHPYAAVPVRGGWLVFQL